MKDKESVINETVYTCPKCSRISLIKIGPDLYQCIGCEPQADISENSDNFAAFVVGLVGWFMLLFLL